MTDTVLVITGAGLTPYSARGITQTLTPINEAGALRRTVNGTLINLAPAQFRKYASTISCTTMDAPALDGVFPGDVLTIDCLPELPYLTSGGSPSRTVVSGSSRTEGDYTFYRPQLTMTVKNFSISTDEWGAAVGWQLDLEET